MDSSSAEFQGELEQMVQNFDTILRWQELFQFSYDQAEQEIRVFRNDSDSDPIVADSEWDRIRHEQEKLGHDRESYEYMRKYRHNIKREPPKDSMFLFVLPMDGPITTAVELQQVLNLDYLPKSLPGTNDDGEEVGFCRVRGETKQMILEEIPGITERSFVVDSFAQKNLLSESKYPTLGIDSTMPQHRLSTTNGIISPQQDQYPVYYFFYGTLCDPDRLSRLLHLAGPPQYFPAQIERGEMTTWNGIYKALVDGESEIQGLAYKVLSVDDETKLRYFETNKYEVVRTSIVMDVFGTSKSVEGLTFRFVG